MFQVLQGRLTAKSPRSWSRLCQELVFVILQLDMDRAPTPFADVKNLLYGVVARFYRLALGSLPFAGTFQVILGKWLCARGVRGGAEYVQVLCRRDVGSLGHSDLSTRCDWKRAEVGQGPQGMLFSFRLASRR